MKLRRISTIVIPGALIAVCLMISTAWAAEPARFTRADFDLIMRWVNFLILAAVVIKYGRAPVKKFLTNKRTEVARSIEQLEEEKRRFEHQVSEGRRQLEAAQERLQQIKEKIIAEGHARREELIADAQRQSQYMLESARLKIDARIREGGRRFRSDLIDMAVDIAAEKLPRLLKADDHQRFVAEWMEAVK